MASWPNFRSFLGAGRDLEPLVDPYESSKGVLQWAILVDLDNRTAVVPYVVGSVPIPAYREILQALATDGYHVTRAVRAKDGLGSSLRGSLG